ncbi:MAG: DUF3341 domain-containing protein [Bacteroidales bacterium]|nr:DUF3341 domain-containing protein [Bacteroidales bacterium]
MKTKSIIGVFEDEANVVKALKVFKEQHIEVNDIFGPCADHDILKNLTKKSRIPHASFFYGVMAVILTFSFLYYTSVIDYPLRYGGKPLFSFPPMVVLMYLMTILTTATLTVFTLLGVIKYFPGKSAKIIDPRVLDDHFVILIEKPADPEKIKSVLKSAGAKEIREE